MNESKTSSRAQLSDKALILKTEKSFEQWFEILDSIGALSMDHAKIVQYLCEQYGEEHKWHFQMVTVVYEREKKNRPKYEKADGLFEISVSKTIKASIHRAYDAWNDSKIRRRWLPEPITIKSATIDKSMRILWHADDTILVIAFYDKNSDKCQVVVQHQKLPGSEEAETMKQFWAKRLEIIKDLIEG